jgi:hypothetical protein
MTRALPLSRYAGRAHLNPEEVAKALSEYVATHPEGLPDDWKDWIELERKEAEDGRDTN